jgi:hypothetical protein
MTDCDKKERETLALTGGVGLVTFSCDKANTADIALDGTPDY